MKPTNPTSTGRAAKKRGPKPKPAEEQLSQLTIRLTPKLKYGLELLARAQHRSLSQAVEWALQVGLNSFEVGAESEPLGELTDLAWKEARESERLLTLYYRAPELLEFEQRAACEMVARSLESERFEPPYEVPMENPTEAQLAAMEAAFEKGRENQKIYNEFVAKTWPAIRAVASRRANSGQDTSNVLLLGELGMLMPGVHNVFEFMANLLPHIPDPFDMAKWEELVSAVMRDYEEQVASWRKRPKSE